MARTLVHNGMLYEIPEEVAEELLAGGVIVPDPDRSADFIVPLNHLFDEVEAAATPARGSRRGGPSDPPPIAVSSNHPGGPR